MNLLPLEMKKHGFNMRQIKRTENSVIYSKAGGYEVMVVRKHNGYELGGQKVEPAEFLPNNEEFGRLGWYFSGPSAIENAEIKYQEISKINNQ